MTSAAKFNVLPGTERKAPTGARIIHNCHPDQVIEISVRLRSKSEAKFHELRGALEKPGFKPISRAEYANTYGANPADVELVKQFAHQFGLTVRHTDNDLARCTVMVSGKISDLQKAFQVALKEYSHPNGNFRGRVGAISVPSPYSEIVKGVFGLDNRPQTEAHFRRRQQAQGVRAAAVSASHDPNDLAKIYDYPAGDGAGQCIALIELGGGFKLDDLKTYFDARKITPPQVISVSVDGGKNSPSTPDSADGEVMLDIEVAGAIAPAAKIVVYFAPNTDQGFLDAITTAAHDTTNSPSVISISWGSAESQWTAQALTNFDEAFQSASAMGVTVCVACGDNGSSDGVADGVTDGSNHVDFPASSSFALGCGGTTLTASNGKILSETVWNDLPSGGATGGGVSNVFPLPSWQNGAGVPASTTKTGGRGVPDVSGDADPNTGYNILVDGETAVFGGTSAVAPLWAGLVARINQQLGKPIGFLNPLIYTKAVADADFNDITKGNNGSFSAASGWDPCTGLGSPDGAKLAAALMPKSPSS